jgi:hypothetical protein
VEEGNSEQFVEGKPELFEEVEETSDRLVQLFLLERWSPKHLYGFSEVYLIRRAVCCSLVVEEEEEVVEKIEVEEIEVEEIEVCSQLECPDKCHIRNLGIAVVQFAKVLVLFSPSNQRFWPYNSKHKA